MKHTKTGKRVYKRDARGRFLPIYPRSGLIRVSAFCGHTCCTFCTEGINIMFFKNPSCSHFGVINIHRANLYSRFYSRLSGWCETHNVPIEDLVRMALLPDEVCEMIADYNRDMNRLR